MTENEIRRAILGALYDAYATYGAGGTVDVMLALEGGGLSKPELFRNIHYLAERGYVAVVGFGGENLVCRITGDGIDLAENRTELDRRLPAPGRSTEVAPPPPTGEPAYASITLAQGLAQVKREIAASQELSESERGELLDHLDAVANHPRLSEILAGPLVRLVLGT